MELAIIFGITFLVLSLYYWYHRPARSPPGPRGIPIVGNTPFMGKFIERTAYQLSKKYGPLLLVRIGREDWLFLNDFDSVNLALIKQSSSFSGRPRSVFYKASPPKGIAFENFGEAWKLKRKFGLVTLRGLGVGKKSMEEFCLEEVSYLNLAIREQDGKPFNISAVLHNAVSNNICSVTIGKRFDYDDKEFNRVLQSLLYSFDNPFAIFVHMAVSLLPTLVDIPPFSFAYKVFIKNGFQVMHDWFLKSVEEHQRTFDETNLRDFVDAFIIEMKKDKSSTYTKLELVQYLHDLFIAGTETASSTLYWGLICLLHYPECQSKLRKEIMDVFGQSGKICMAKKVEMPFTNAFIQELFRYRTVKPLSLVHKTSQVSELCGYVIPKNTMVIPNIWAVHNDTKFWKEPEKFIPERFLDDAGRFMHSKRVIPFSVGSRHCLGEQLARMEVFLFLVGMVQKYEFLPDPGAEKLPEIETGRSGFAFVPLPYKIVAKQL